MQRWWLQPTLQGLDGTVLYLGATALTAITDNAALTYLGSLVQGIDDNFKFALVAGAISGGGLTVIANAPNPAGYSILKSKYKDESIGALGLFIAAITGAESRAARMTAIRSAMSGGTLLRSSRR